MTTTNPPIDFQVGRIVGVFGLQGELKCDPTAAGRTVFFRGSELRCERRDGSHAIRVASVREHKGRLLVRFEGVESADGAQPYAMCTLYAPRERLDVGPGEYLDADLAGCAVESAAGVPLGEVERIDHYPASDMLIVGGKMIPMVAAFVRSIDVTAKRIVVDVPPGLLDDDAV